MRVNPQVRLQALLRGVPAGRHQARVAFDDPRVRPVREARPAKRVGDECPQAAGRRWLAGARAMDPDDLREFVVAEGGAVPSGRRSRQTIERLSWR
jgi:hypothetical protein